MKLPFRIRSVPPIAAIMCFVIIAGSFPKAAFAMSVDEACVAAANRLVARQNATGEWREEEDFTGSIVAGLVRAYELTEDIRYLAAAELGAAYILDVAGGNFFGDEAYALSRLGEVTGEPAYLDVVREFYDSLDTVAYIQAFAQTDRSTAVFYLSYHAVAASNVGAVDAEIWRTAVKESLCLIDDGLAYYPVLSLGVATWALAQTGLMDDSNIDPDAAGESRWTDVKLSDLPDMLAAHQVPQGGRFAGSFYYRFDHQPPEAGLSEWSGYTEDAVYGLLGLVASTGAAREDGTTWDFSREIEDAKAALTNAVSESGSVYDHIWARWTGRARYVLCGETLEALGSKASADALLQGGDEQLPVVE